MFIRCHLEGLWYVRKTSHAGYCCSRRTISNVVWSAENLSDSLIKVIQQAALRECIVREMLIVNTVQTIICIPSNDADPTCHEMRNSAMISAKSKPHVSSTSHTWKIDDFSFDLAGSNSQSHFCTKTFLVIGEFFYWIFISSGEAVLIATCFCDFYCPHF